MTTRNSPLREAELGRKITLVFNESLTAALREKAQDRADLIIGKQSVVQFDVRKSKIELTLLAMLSGKDGSTTQTGLLVVPSRDAAQAWPTSRVTASSLDPRKATRSMPPHSRCSNNSTCLGAWQARNVRRLRRGCLPRAGTAGRRARCGCHLELRQAAARRLRHRQEGDLKVIGETQPVPFIAAFATGSVPAEQRQPLLDALVKVSSDPQIRLAL